MQKPAFLSQNQLVPQGQNRRAALRVACGMDVIVEFDNGEQRRCRTVDISTTGAQLKFREVPRIRGHMMERLIIRGVGTFAITTRWTDGHKAGVRFTGTQEEAQLLSDLLEHLERMRINRLAQ